jgi:hypothetical protein
MGAIGLPCILLVRGPHTSGTGGNAPANSLAALVIDAEDEIPRGEAGSLTNNIISLTRVNRIRGWIEGQRSWTALLQPQRKFSYHRCKVVRDKMHQGDA